MRFALNTGLGPAATPVLDRVLSHQAAAFHLIVAAFTNPPTLRCPLAQIHRTVGFRFDWVRRSLM